MRTGVCVCSYVGREIKKPPSAGVVPAPEGLGVTLALDPPDECAECGYDADVKPQLYHLRNTMNRNASTRADMSIVNNTYSIMLRRRGT